MNLINEEVRVGDEMKAEVEKYEVLTIADRLILLDCLSVLRGDITAIRIARELKEDLSFSEEEHKAFNLKANGPEVTWDEREEALKKFYFGAKGKQIIANALKELSNKKMLTDRHLSLYERFVEKKEEEI